MTNNSYRRANIRPIFIVGNVHTGTTLLQTIIGKSNSVFSSSGETQYFYYLPKIRARFTDLRNDGTAQEFLHYLLQIICGQKTRKTYQPHLDYRNDKSNCELTETEKHQLAEMIRETNDPASAFGNVFCYLAYRSGNSYWLEKTPGHLFYIESIIDLYSEARFIELVRDPRAILASRKARQAKDWQDRNAATRILQKEDDFFLASNAYDPIHSSLAWKAAIAAGNRASIAHPGHILRIRYEDLTGNPTRTISVICDFLGLEFSNVMLDVSLKNSPHKSQTRGSGITQASIDKWRTQLTSEEIYICQLINRNAMRELHYPCQPMTLSDKLNSTKIAVRSININVKRLLARTRRFGLASVFRTLRTAFLRNHPL